MQLSPSIPPKVADGRVERRIEPRVRRHEEYSLSIRWQCGGQVGQGLALIFDMLQNVHADERVDAELLRPCRDERVFYRAVHYHRSRVAVEPVVQHLQAVNAGFHNDNVATRLDQER